MMNSFGRLFDPNWKPKADVLTFLTLSLQYCASQIAHMIVVLACRLLVYYVMSMEVIVDRRNSCSLLLETPASLMKTLLAGDLIY